MATPKYFFTPTDLTNALEKAKANAIAEGHDADIKKKSYAWYNDVIHFDWANAKTVNHVWVNITASTSKASKKPLFLRSLGERSCGWIGAVDEERAAIMTTRYKDRFFGEKTMTVRKFPGTQVRFQRFLGRVEDGAQPDYDNQSELVKFVVAFDEVVATEIKIRRTLGLLMSFEDMENHSGSTDGILSVASTRYMSGIQTHLSAKHPVKAKQNMPLTNPILKVKVEFALAGERKTSTKFLDKTKLYRKNGTPNYEVLTFDNQKITAKNVNEAIQPGSTIDGTIKMDSLCISPTGISAPRVYNMAIIQPYVRTIDDSAEIAGLFGGVENIPGVEDAKEKYEEIEPDVPTVEEATTSKTTRGKDQVVTPMNNDDYDTMDAENEDI
jgi:hypothetical protein